MRKEECLEKFVTTYTRQVSSVWLYIAILTALFFGLMGYLKRRGLIRRFRPTSWAFLSRELPARDCARPMM